MFELGQSYKRTDLHKQYGGQRQGGISTPRRWPFLFLFTGKSGSHFGYEDNWHDGLFLYTGEGQSGDMQFRAGNKAIRLPSSTLSPSRHIGQRFPRLHRV
jgi:5-methylcytosine-specific restriction protein A